MGLNQNEVNSFKEQLEKLKKELTDSIQQAKHNSQPVTLDQQSVGRVSRVDAIQQQQMHKASLVRLEQRLKMTEAALDRIRAGIYGYCTACEEPIAQKRLLARPEAHLCVGCAK